MTRKLEATLLGTVGGYEIYQGYRQGDIAKPVWICRDPGTRETWGWKTLDKAIEMALTGKKGVGCGCLSR